MKSQYACLGCQHEFEIEVSADESASTLDSMRSDTCPECNAVVGMGSVTCRGCGENFILPFPHWHVHCDLANGNCPSCGAQYVSFCIC